MSNPTALIVLAITMAVVSVTFDAALTKSEQLTQLTLELQTVAL